MSIIVGLGNPGEQYRSTRHNIGFLVVDALANRFRSHFERQQSLFEKSEFQIRERAVSLIKPLTYMNRSGEAISEFMLGREQHLEHMLVVCDDFNLPLGTIRLRERGGDGGHNGLLSIIEALQSQQFSRLRCGIASEEMPSDKSQMADFVLDPFADWELTSVRTMIDQAADACVCFIAEGITAAMNTFNKRVDGECGLSATESQERLS
jgi:PTH1 family peptidyl-tRNA hydrolase